MTRKSMETRVRWGRWKLLLTFTTKDHAPLLFAAVCFALAAGAIPPTFSILLGKIFAVFAAYGQSVAKPETFKSSTTTYCTYLAGVGVVSLALNTLALTTWMTFGEFQASAGRIAIFDGLIKRPAAWFDSREGEVLAISSRTQSQLRELQLATSQPLGYVLEYASTTVLALAIAFYYCWNLTLVVFAAVPISAVILSRNSRNIQYHIDLQRRFLTIASRNAESAFNAIDTVKACNGQETEIARYSSAIANAAKYYLRQARTNAQRVSLIRFVTMSMFVQGFWYGSYLVSTGSQSPATIVTTFWSCLMAMTAIEQIISQLMILEKGLSAGAALRALCVTKDGQTLTSKSHESLRPDQCTGAMELKMVSFCYPNNPTISVLADVDMFFRPGRVTFLIGQSGSGKSTVAQLLCNLYRPGSGQVFLDGVPLEKLNQQWLRNSVTLVEQEAILFNDTLLQNIANGRHEDLDLRMDDIERAAEFALLRETIDNTSSGLLSRIGPDGAALSGGERQRIALARAKVRDAPVLILDESTSALDPANRALMLSNIREWRKNKTTIIISHDMSQIRETDHVCLLHNGKVMFEGLGIISRFGYKSEVAQNPASSEAVMCSSSSPNFETRSNITSAGFLRFETSDGSPMLAGINDCPSPKMKDWSSFVPQALTTQDHSPHIAESRRNVSRARLISAGTPSFELKRLDTRYTGKRQRDLCFLRGLQRLSELAIPKRLVKSEYKMLPASDMEMSIRSSYQSSAENISFWPMSKIFATVRPNLDRRGNFMLFVGSASAITHAIATPIFSSAFSKLLETLIDYSHEGALNWSLAILVIAIVDSPAIFLMHYCLDYCGQQWVDNIRKVAMRRILDQSRQFTMSNANSPDILVHRLDRNAEEMRNLVSRFAAAVLISIVMMSIAVVWSVFVSWRLSLVMLSLILLPFMVAKMYQKVSLHMENQVNTATDRASAVFHETFTKISTVRNLTMESYFRGKYKRIVRHVLVIAFRKAIYCGLFYGVSESLISFTTALVFYCGAILISSGANSMSEILLVISLLIFSTLKLASIVSLIPQGQSSKDTARSLLALATLPHSSHEHGGLLKPLTLDDIVFSDVSFAYPSRPDELALKQVNITFKKGTFTALVGISGSGKSTIANLVLRMYAVDDSKLSKLSGITLSDQSIQDIDVERLRQLISIVPQQPILFPGTVAQNIAYGHPKDFKQRKFVSISTAAKLAGIDDFIKSLPQSYNTPVGPGGMNLSGGQTQRLAVARALLRQPAVLILDEATSALDEANARLIRDSIKSLTDEHKELTIIAITHSREMMELSEKIVVMENGEVMEEGAFEELLARNGRLSNLLRNNRSK